MASDTVGEMIATALAARGPDEPFHVTARRIFLLGVDDLTDAERAGLEATGFAAIERGVAPGEIDVPSATRMVEAKEPYGRDRIDPEQRPRLMLVGFLALAAEQAANSDGDDA